MIITVHDFLVTEKTRFCLQGFKLRIYSMRFNVTTAGFETVLEEYVVTLGEYHNEWHYCKYYNTARKVFLVFNGLVATTADCAALAPEHFWPFQLVGKRNTPSDGPVEWQATPLVYGENASVYM